MKPDVLILALIPLALGIIADLLLRRAGQGFKVRWIAWTMGLTPGLLLVAALAWLALEPRSHPAERAPQWYLKTIATAQLEFRSNDLDRDGQHNFWRKDIAGLYSLKGSDGKPIALVSIHLAAADDLPATPYPAGGPIPFKGHLFRAMSFADEKSPNPDRFAACCYPSRYDPSDSIGRRTYIISEDTILYSKDLGPSGGLTIYPENPEDEGWKKLY